MYKSTVFVALVSLAATVSPVAIAQTSPIPEKPASPIGLDEIIVTAQKRAESLQDTPIAIAALDTEALEKKRVTSLLEIASGVPNVQISPGTVGPTSVRIIIRGIGQLSNAVTLDAPVAVYQDGVYLGRTQGMGNELAELERVEVLRGPQGTLYGRNATAGAINFITKAPELGELNFNQKFTIGNLDEFRSRTAVNIPLGDDLAVGLAFVHAKRDGFIRNIGTGAPWFGAVNRNGFRAAALWSPSDAFEARYTFDYTKIKDTSNFAAVVPFLPPEAERPRTGSAYVEDFLPNSTSAQGHNLTLTYDLSDTVTVKSITGYRELDSFEYQDFNTGVFGPYSLSRLSDSTDQKQFSQELQLIGDAIDGRLKYIAGLYYFTEKGDASSLQNTPTGRNLRTATFKNKAYAVFGQGTYTPDFLDQRLHLTLGLRWSKDKREASLLNVSIPPAGPQTTLIDGSGDNAFDDFSPSGTLQFDINDDVNVYAKVVKGYKSGGFSLSASSPDSFARGFGPEKIISYEAGLKSELFDRRVRFNLAAFYNDYKDIQTNVIDPRDARIFDIINAGKAVTKGFDADITVLVAQGLTLQGSYGYVDAKYKKVVDLAGNDITDGFVMPHAPKNSFSVSANYTSPETRIGVFDATVGYDWQDKYVSLGTDRRYAVASNGLLNATVGLSGIGNFEGWRVAIWGRNLTDETYYLSTFPVGLPTAFFGLPRTYGVDLSIKF